MASRSSNTEAATPAAGKWSDSKNWRSGSRVRNRHRRRLRIRSTEASRRADISKRAQRILISRSRSTNFTLRPRRTSLRSNNRRAWWQPILSWGRGCGRERRRRTSIRASKAWRTRNWSNHSSHHRAARSRTRTRCRTFRGRCQKNISITLIISSTSTQIRPTRRRLWETRRRETQTKTIHSSTGNEWSRIRPSRTSEIPMGINNCFKCREKNNDLLWRIILIGKTRSFRRFRKMRFRWVYSCQLLLVLPMRISLCRLFRIQWAQWRCWTRIRSPSLLSCRQLPPRCRNLRRIRTNRLHLPNSQWQQKRLWKPRPYLRNPGRIWTRFKHFHLYQIQIRTAKHQNRQMASLQNCS